MPMTVPRRLRWRNMCACPYTGFRGTLAFTKPYVLKGRLLMTDPQIVASPLRNSAFRRLFTAQVIALVGTGMTTVALTLLAYDMVQENAGAVLGAALAFKMVAYVVFAKQ